ncbi:MAG: GNAT family N-acetyltransferase [Coleofasciculaceae cyanobacterium]
MSDATEKIPDILITTYLQMTDKSQFKPGYLADTTGLSLKQMSTNDIEFYRYLYSAVGKKWRWKDRSMFSDQQIKTILETPGNSVQVLYVNNNPAGFIELAKSEIATKIVYFGLCSDYMGLGLGKHLLSCGIAQAWNNDTKRLWVHTCNLDSPYALDNYIKRGFQVYQIDKQPMQGRYP